MYRPEEPIIDSGLNNNTFTIRRRKLLPWWIKVFIWIFLVFGAIAPVGFIFGLFGFQFKLALYRFETFLPLSYIGLGITFLFILKGVTAFGLWMEKDWAITLGQIEAILGVVICVFAMILPFVDKNPDFTFSLRLELVLLIPFLIKLGKIKEEWLNGPDELKRLHYNNNKDL